MDRGADTLELDGLVGDARLLASLNLIQQALSIYDDDLLLVAGNRKFADMFDLPDHLVRPGARFDATIRHLAIRGEYGDGDIDAMVAERVALAEAFEPHYFERLRPNGEYISVEGHPLRQGGWVAVYTDITGFRRQEELLKARSESLNQVVGRRNAELARANRELTAANTELSEGRRQLAQSEARLRLVAEATPGHLAYADADRIYRYSNLRFDTDLMRVPNPVGRRMDQALRPEIYQGMEKWIDRAFQGEALSRDHDVTLPDGGFAALRTVLTPHLSETGDLLGIYILTLNITEQRLAADQLTQSQKMEATATATSALSHDFANLLTIIMGLQGRLSRNEMLPSDAKEMIEGIGVAARRGAALVDQLSAVSGERAMTPKPVDVAAALTQITDMFQSGATDAPRITLAFDDELGWAMLDAGYLHDVMLNLLLNARDASEVVKTPQILLRAEISAGMLCISVEDNGPGFPSDIKDRVFDPFFTTKGAKGVGLGLSTVYNFARASRGRVTAARSSLGGAAVRLTLPYKPAHPAPGQDTKTDIGVDGIALVIDDEPEVRATARDILRDLGWPVLEANSAAEAETLTRNITDIRLVLSDITMPDIDGPSLLRAIRDERPDLRCFLMTGLPATAPLRQVAAEEFEVVQKPFDRSTLAAVIRGGDR